MSHAEHIFVTCWKCKKDFDITEAEHCLEHLTNGWTTKCSHCGACICHKIDKMKPIECEVLNKKGINKVMPSVYKTLIQIQQSRKTFDRNCLP